MLMFNNLIDGEWMSDGARSPNVNPSDTNDIVGEAVRGTRAQADAAVAAAKAAFPAWSRSTPQVRYDILKKASDEILARKANLCVLRRRVPAYGWREAGLGAPRHRHRDHPGRAGGCRPDHAVEFPDRD